MLISSLSAILRIASRGSRLSDKNVLDKPEIEKRADIADISVLFFLWLC